MKTHLLKATQDPQAGISQISETDADIISQVIRVLKMAKYDKLANVLDEWKLKTDDEVLATMLKIEDELSEQTEGAAGDGYKSKHEIPVIQLNGEYILVKNISNWGKVAVWDDEGICHRFGIIFNRDEEGKLNLPNANKIVYYDTGQERDKALENLEEILIERNFVFKSI